MLSKTEKEIFAILFASGEALEAIKLSENFNMDEEAMIKTLAVLSDKLIEEDFPIRIAKMDKKYQLITDMKLAPLIRDALYVKKNTTLSQAAMETLAIIAYNQPVTRSFVEHIRGVDCSNVISSLTEKLLIEESGRLDLPGKPIAYKTNENFLRCFGITSLDELPIIEYNDDEEDLIESKTAEEE